MKRYRDSQIRKIKSLPIDVRLGVRANRALAQELAPDVIIAATGGEPVVPPILGVGGNNVVIGADITPETVFGKKLVIIGGGLVGCELAVYYAGKGHKAVILEMLPGLASDCGRMHKISLDHEIETNENIAPVTGMRCTRIDREGVCAVDTDGKEWFYEADSVIIAAGMHSKDSERDSLQNLASEFYAVGDANRARGVMEAVREGYDAAVSLGMTM